MKKIKKSQEKSKVPTILGLMVLVAGLFLATKAVGRIQDNRSSAAEVGGCLVYKEFYTNEEVYAVNGSTFCGEGGGWFHKDVIYKCDGSKAVSQKIDCNDKKDGCMDFKGDKVSSKKGDKDQTISYWKFSAKCRDDSGCTNLKGTCNVDLKNGPKVDQKCTTSDGKEGIVKSDLCLSKASFDKRCCVPGANKESCKTTSSCSKLGGRCDNPNNKKSDETTKSGLCPGGNDCVCIIKKTGKTRCKPGDGTKLLREIKYTGESTWNSYTKCSSGTYCVDKYYSGVGMAAACLTKK